MTNQIIFPAEYGRLRGRIASSVQDSPVAYTIFARRANGDYIDITGASIDAKFELISTGAVYDSTGTFVVVDGAGGEFTWLPSAADLGLAGDFYLQFTIDGERSEDNLTWEVQARLDSDGSTPPTAMTSLTAAQVALVAAIQGLTGLIKMAAGSATGVAIQSFMQTFLTSATALAARANLLPSYTGNGTKVLAVNSGATDVEWVAQSGGAGAVESVFGRTGVVEAHSGDYNAGLIDVTGGVYTGSTVESALDAVDNAIGGRQPASAKLDAITALTWAANSLIWLTGTTTASVQALASHVVTFLQSANAAAARAAIGAGNGDVTGPASSTDNAIARYDSATGKIIQNSSATVDDSGNVYAAAAMGINSSQFVGLSGNQLRIGNASAWFQIAFYTDSVAKMLLDINGLLGIGTTAPQGKIHSYHTGGGFMHVYKSGVNGSATTVIADGTGDVTLCLSGTFTISDGAGNTGGGVITKTVPGGTVNLYDDGGTNTCQLQISAGGAVTVIRTAGSRTYAVNLILNWM